MLDSKRVTIYVPENRKKVKILRLSNHRRRFDQNYRKMRDLVTCIMLEDKKIIYNLRIMEINPYIDT